MNSSKTKLIAVSMALSLGLTPLAALANTSCSGPVSFVGSDNAGNVYVNINSYGVWEVCNVSEPFTSNSVTVTPDSCKTWYTAFLASQSSGVNVQLYFYSSTACSAFGNWVEPSPYFVQPE